MARLAYSLETLRNQINAEYPGRNKASDGWIGDSEHQKVASDHNPNSEGVVTALDITNSPQTDFDAHALADRLLEKRHPDLKYLISNGRIAGAWTNWGWVPYHGTDPHENHIHVSVGRGEDGQSTAPYDDTTKWNVTNKENTVVNAEDVYALFQGFRNRQPNQTELDQFVGKWSYSALIKALNSGPDRDLVVRQLTTGITAEHDDWAGQIKRLRDAQDYEVVNEKLYRKKG